jgi:hypothetical protein
MLLQAKDLIPGNVYKVIKGSGFYSNGRIVRAIGYNIEPKFYDVWSEGEPSSEPGNLWTETEFIPITWASARIELGPDCDKILHSDIPAGMRSAPETAVPRLIENSDGSFILTAPSDITDSPFRFTLDGLQIWRRKASLFDVLCTEE